MIVTDATVVVAALISAVDGGVASVSRIESDTVHAPELLDLEVLSAVRGHLLGRRLSAAQAAGAVGDLGVLPVLRHRHTLLAGRVWALRNKVCPYDAAYVALAEMLGCALVTLDRRLARAPGLGCEVELLG